MNDDNQVKLIISPPPARAEDFRNDRLSMEVFGCVIFEDFFEN